MASPIWRCITIPTAAISDRLFFGVGSATNSGIVGLDNMRWLRKYRNFCDQAFVTMELLGLRSLSKNPFASLFVPGSGETADTGPLPAIRHERQDDDRRNADQAAEQRRRLGGDRRGRSRQIVAYAFRNPQRSGIVGSRYRSIFTNQGMEMRGSRPVKDDHDALIHTYTVGPPTPGGFPDYTTSMEPVSQAQFQPPLSAFPPNNVPKVGSLFEHSNEAGGFQKPDPGQPDARSRTLTHDIPAARGAAKLCLRRRMGHFPIRRFAAICSSRCSGDTLRSPQVASRCMQPVGIQGRFASTPTAARYRT